MKFGIRECANVVFRAKQPMSIGKYSFKVGQPVLYIDTATTSSVEQASTTVYAQGGRGNVRLVTWEGEKTLTVTVEDALLSPISFAMLSGADLFQGSSSVSKVHFHTTSMATMTVDTSSSPVKATIDLSSVLGEGENICNTNDAPIYVVITDSTGDLTGETVTGTVTVKAAASGDYQVIEIASPQSAGIQDWASASRTSMTGNISVFVDYYLDKTATAVDELQIAADNFAGNYYVEADTLFRRKSDGKDLPANLTFPNAKIQSNFTFSLSGTGDPSTFTFTMDCLPGYTYFDKTREVLCVLQVVEDQNNATKKIQPVMPHNDNLEHADDEIDDSQYIGYGTTGGTTKGNAKITVTGASHTVAADGTLSLTATSVPSGASVTWSSSDNNKATVNTSGVVSGVAAGKVTITASATGYKAGTFEVTVTGE